MRTPILSLYGHFQIDPILPTFIFVVNIKQNQTTAPAYEYDHIQTDRIGGEEYKEELFWKSEEICEQLT
jgi:hypothetical protein